MWSEKSLESIMEMTRAACLPDIEWVAEELKRRAATLAPGIEKCEPKLIQTPLSPSSSSGPPESEL